VVSEDLETLSNAPKQEERKFNLCLTRFKVKEGETEKKLVQRLNTKLLHGHMKLCAKVVVATRQWLVVVQTFALVVGVCPDGVVIKLKTSEDH
jgi:hypothetical protein